MNYLYDIDTLDALHAMQLIHGAFVPARYRRFIWSIKCKTTDQSVVLHSLDWLSEQSEHPADFQCCHIKIKVAAFHIDKLPGVCRPGKYGTVDIPAKTRTQLIAESCF